jgi:hypothetical protein
VRPSGLPWPVPPGRPRRGRRRQLALRDNQGSGPATLSAFTNTKGEHGGERCEEMHLYASVAWGASGGLVVGLRAFLDARREGEQFPPGMTSWRGFLGYLFIHAVVGGAPAGAYCSVGTATPWLAFLIGVGALLPTQKLATGLAQSSMKVVPVLQALLGAIAGLGNDTSEKRDRMDSADHQRSPDALSPDFSRSLDSGDLPDLEGNT